jgi:hypothetical protein
MKTTPQPKLSASDRAWNASVDKILSDPALEEARAKARERERIAAIGVDPNRITDKRRKLLEFVRDEGAVTAKDVARSVFGNVRLVRAAAAQIAALTTLGLLTPLRTSEFKLSPLGKQVLGA